jgi:DNA ligase-1
MPQFKPMLAAKLEDVGPLQFPLLASPKLDGVRAVILNGVVLSRSLKPIPNKHVQALFGRPELEGLDGELCVGPANAKDLMQRTMSGVMSSDGTPDVCFHVFDLANDPGVFCGRDDRLGDRVEELTRGCLFPLVHVLQDIIENEGDLAAYEAEQLAAGYEGVMLRDPQGLYKQGRCGKKQPWLVKVKRFVDDEAIVIGVEELMHNDNPAETNELGRTKRSTHQANKRPAGVLGALVCMTKGGVTFNIGTGFTAAQRASYYGDHCDDIALGGVGLVGRIAKFKHFQNAGVKDAPRFPVFLCFRDPRDL